MRTTALWDWMTGTQRPREPKKRKPYLWERPDLIDPPLRPLPSSRPRRLTAAADTHDQLQCTLIARLPAEIRVLIWEDVLGGEVLHLELADGILRYNPCFQRESTLPVFQHDCWRAAWRKSFRSWARAENQPEGYRPAVMPLLFTCKLVYTEAVGLIYSANSFDFRRADAILRLPNVMLPHRLQQLRHIHFSTAFSCRDPPELPPGLPADFWKLPDDKRQWPAACDMLASLQHLQSLRVTLILLCQLERHRHSQKTELLYDVLQPLNAVHASDFTVEITEHFEVMRERIETAPFRLVEREKPV